MALSLRTTATSCQSTWHDRQQAADQVDEMSRRIQPIRLVKAQKISPGAATLYGPQFRDVLAAGHEISTIEYVEAHLQRLNYAGVLKQIFANIDLIISPSYTRLLPLAAQPLHCLRASRTGASLVAFSSSANASKRTTCPASTTAGLSIQPRPALGSFGGAGRELQEKLPSKGRGRAFESRRVHQLFQLVRQFVSFLV